MHVIYEKKNDFSPRRESLRLDGLYNNGSQMKIFL